MKYMKRNPFGLFLIIILCVVSGYTAEAIDVRKSVSNNEQDPIIIKSNTLEVNEAMKVVTFAGEVNAKNKDFVMDCQKMVVHYKNRPSKDNAEQVETTIDRIIATGHVNINRVQGGTATANEAVYYLQEEKIVLTDNPVVKQGNDVVEGDRITIFLKENRSVVESGKDKRVRAVIFPKREKR